ncbi:dephospho-CoA kinase/protein folding accessory domain-containing protein [Arthrobacter crystallopoietes BAB-32]|uniref:Dephospho-CoA kinase n=1 Tax=Arthrobacter crystallopoietes BAB-32 TaxID=1246476 RepID=N1UZR8_9MICC|nr:dephospho-CoA kinase [Arthrobacter crystallopoietes]EMY35896.1 dephospho-CoA kinase/protein folding accessory domain-containing protein [Arthrobacter crystallopoietes BAB-32]
MLKVGLTGGIAAGKSMVARRLSELGAVLVDADVLAREVVEPGTEGLQAIADCFGSQVINDGGGLDRAALGAIVFGDQSKREQLNAIVHPLVRARSAQLVAEAGPDAIVVEDIPLLVETGQGAHFHLVVVVDAPEDVRILRMVQLRGMAAEDARARIAAQATAEQRQAAADVVLANTSSAESLLAAVDGLWEQRLVPFAGNLAAGRIARGGGPELVEALPEWRLQAQRLAARIAAADPRILAVAHIGSTAVPGLAAKDVIDLQVAVESLADADALAGNLAAAGFPRWPGQWRDMPKPSEPNPAAWEKRLHGNADPARRANVHIRVQGSPGWRYALAFRDWLRADPSMAAEYLAEKRRLSRLHAADSSAGRYAKDKDQWFTNTAEPALREWIRSTGWRPEEASDF